MIIRELRMFTRNRVAMMVFFGAPILFGLIVGFVYQKADVSKLPVCVVDLDNTQLSQKIIDAINDNEYIDVVMIKDDQAQAQKLFKHGKVDAVITIPENFSGEIQQKRYPEIQLDLNTLNILTANYITRGVSASLQTINAGIEIETLQKKGMTFNVASTQFESFKLNIDRYFNPMANYLQFLWPGVICTIFQQVVLLVMALVFSKEFESRTFNTLLHYSNNAFVLILIKVIPYLVLSTCLWFGIVYGMFPFFKIPIHANIFTMILFSMVFIISVLFFGIMASVIFPTQLMSTEVLMIIATPSFIISGFTWPMSQMPGFIKIIANTIPLTHYVDGFRRLAYMDATLTDVFPQIIAMLIIAIVTAFVAWIVLRYKILAYRSNHKLIKTVLNAKRLRKVTGK